MRVGSWRRGRERKVKVETSVKGGRRKREEKKEETCEEEEEEKGL